MKFTHKLCGAALLAAVGFAVVLPNSTKADDGVGVEGGAEIEFTSTSESTTETNPGSGSGTDVLPSDTGTSDAHGFGISYVTNLDFGKHENMTNTGNETYWAKSWVGTNEDGVTMENANFVNFEDVRQQVGHAYQIQAELTTEFTADVNGKEAKLNGVSLTYNNPGLNTRHLTDDSTAPTAGLKNGAVVQLGAKTTMLDNSTPADDEVGYGYYSLYYGKYELGEAEGGSAKSIKLAIPMAENKAVYNAKYKGGITWTMSDVPQP